MQPAIFILLRTMFFIVPQYKSGFLSFKERGERKKKESAFVKFFKRCGENFAKLSIRFEEIVTDSVPSSI